MSITYSCGDSFRLQVHVWREVGDSVVGAQLLLSLWQHCRRPYLHRHGASWGQALQGSSRQRAGDPTPHTDPLLPLRLWLARLLSSFHEDQREREKEREREDRLWLETVREVELTELGNVEFEVTVFVLFASFNAWRRKLWATREFKLFDYGWWHVLTFSFTRLKWPVCSVVAKVVPVGRRKMNWAKMNWSQLLTINWL